MDHFSKCFWQIATLLYFVPNFHPLCTWLTVPFRVFNAEWKTAQATEERRIQYISLLSALIMFLYFRPHAVFHFFSNILQFTTDQNLLIKKDIFGAAHFPMTCQPFWASCHLPSQHCGWGLIPGKLCELWASKREGDRQRAREEGACMREREWERKFVWCICICVGLG